SRADTFPRDSTPVGVQALLQQSTSPDKPRSPNHSRNGPPSVHISNPNAPSKTMSTIKMHQFSRFIPSNATTDRSPPRTPLLPSHPAHSSHPRRRHPRLLPPAAARAPRPPA